MKHIHRHLMILLTVALVVSGLGLSLTAADDFDGMVLGEDAENLQRPPVPFDHDAHMESAECLDCHHQYEDGENVLDESELEEGDPDILCGACHNDTASIDLQKAFHRQCIGCHTALRKAGEGRAPEMCGTCHVKHTPPA